MKNFRLDIQNSRFNYKTINLTTNTHLLIGFRKQLETVVTYIEFTCIICFTTNFYHAYAFILKFGIFRFSINVENVISSCGKKRLWFNFCSGHQNIKQLPTKKTLDNCNAQRSCSDYSHIWLLHNNSCTGTGHAPRTRNYFYLFCPQWTMKKPTSQNLCETSGYVTIIWNDLNF